MSANGVANRPVKNDKAPSGNAFGTLRNLGQKLGAAKINVLEKMGRRETTESAEMQAEIRKVEECRSHLKDIYKGLYKHHKSVIETIKDQRSLADSYSAYGAKLSNNGDFPTLGGMFTRLSTFQGCIEQITDRLDFLLALQMGEALKDFVKGDVREARHKKRNFDKIRQNYESSLEQLKQAQKQKNPTKTQLAQEEVDRQKEAYEQALYETQSMLEDCNRMNGIDTLEKCCDFIEAYNEFFTKGAAFCTEMMPRVNKHREQIIHQREQMKNDITSRDAAHSSSGTKGAKVFGCPIEEVAKREGGLIPLVVSKAIDYLNKNGLEVEGIFRVSGTKTEIDALKKQFEEGKNPDLNKVEDPHVVSGLVKQFFRELPVPLFTYDLFDQFMETYEIQDENKRFEALQPLVERLPAVNRETLKAVLNLCSNIVQHVDKNRMTPGNLATVLGPNFINRKEQNFYLMKSDLERGNAILECIIDKLCEEKGSKKAKHQTISLRDSMNDPSLLPGNMSGNTNSSPDYYPKSADSSPAHHHAPVHKSASSPNFTTNPSNSPSPSPNHNQASGANTSPNSLDPNSSANANWSKAVSPRSSYGWQTANGGGRDTKGTEVPQTTSSAPSTPSNLSSSLNAIPTSNSGSPSVSQSSNTPPVYSPPPIPGPSPSNTRMSFDSATPPSKWTGSRPGVPQHAPPPTPPKPTGAPPGVLSRSGELNTGAQSPGKMESLRKQYRSITGASIKQSYSAESEATDLPEDPQ